MLSDITPLIIVSRNFTMYPSVKFELLAIFLLFLFVILYHAYSKELHLPIVEERQSDSHARDIENIMIGNYKWLLSSI